MAPPPASGLDLTAPLRAAYDRTRRLLFPFDFSRWITLGFSAWIASLGEGGASMPNVPDTSGRRGGGSSQIVDFVRDNLALIVTVGVVVLVVGVGIGVLLLWVSSRGKFVFLDNVVHERALVEEPWRRFSEHGSALFRVRLALSMISLALVLSAVGLFLWLAWPDLAAGIVGSRLMIGAGVGVGILLLDLPLAVLAALLEDFVVPTMYLDGPDWRAAASRVRAALSGQVATLIAFYLLRIAVAVASGVVAMLATCLTCCIAGLPFIGTVLLLPVIVFGRAYVWCFYEQLGPDFRLFPLGEHELPG
ncbi:MAG: hypothetical protein R3B13_23900 [Polyangiaceae bacterium]